MLAKNCTVGNLEDALMEVNKKFDGNIRFKKLDNTNRGIRFTLTVNSSKGKGGRLSVPYFDGKQKRVAAACWHVHGEFFDALFEIAPDAVIVAGEKKITQYGGNWQDILMGSQMNPAYYSELCECGL